MINHPVNPEILFQFYSSIFSFFAKGKGQDPKKQANYGIRKI